MKKKLIAWAMALALCLTMLPGMALAADQKTVHAGTAEELRSAVASNTKIVLEGKHYDLGYDSIDVEGLENLTIEGAAGTEITTTDSMSNVMYFSECKNVTLTNLSLGHNVPAEVGCGDGVLDVIDSTVTFNNCDIYGCGMWGIHSYKSDIVVENTTIRDCSTHILDVSDGSADFNNCAFTGNGYKSPSIEALWLNAFEDPCKVTFSNCVFANNDCPQLHNTDENSNVTVNFTDCKFYNNAWGDDNVSSMPSLDGIGYGSAGNSAGGTADSTPVTTTPKSGFSDVPDSSPFSDAVAWAVEQGITTGVTANSFEPSTTCTHNHILTFLWRSQGSPDAEGSGDFEKALNWAKSEGIADADVNGGDPCTRADAVMYLWQLAGMPDADVFSPAFKDVSPADDEYATAVAWAVENNITKGVSEYYFEPDTTCTRGQIVTFLYRAYA